MSIQRFLLIGSFCLSCVASLAAQLTVEQQVLSTLRTLFQAGGGGVNFSSLYNDERFSSEEKAFLGRLYEIFFALPGFLAEQEEQSGQIPSRQQLAGHFQVSPNSIELLLQVMASDRRIPPLFERAAGGGEITSLNRANIAAFLKGRGSAVKFTQWEGQPLPAFTLTSIQGETFSSRASLAGRPSLLYFWFTGCPPCVRLAPILADLAKTYGGGTNATGVTFVGLNADNLLEIGTSDADRRAYAQKQGFHFANLNLDAATRSAFGNIQVYPTLFLVDAQGTIRHHLINFQSKEKLEALLDGLVPDGGKSK